MLQPAQVSLQDARQIAVHAQGLHCFQRDAEAAIRQMAILQLDFVNVVTPSHHLVLYSRVRGYRRTDLDALAYSPERKFTEHWAHEACIVPFELWPYLRYRRENPHRWFAGHVTAGYLKQVTREIERLGAMRSDQLTPPAKSTPGRIPGAWYGTVQRMAMESLFATGSVCVTSREPDFARVYDLSHRVVPGEHHGARIRPADQHRELLRHAAKALGVGTAADLADYFRMPMAIAKPRIEELASVGDLKTARVEGWKELAYLDPHAATAGRAERTVLLSPFDPLIWFRKRTQRLFNFEYKLEIFTPEAKRRWGCFVFPFLIGNQLAARVDLKAERRNGVLAVLATYVEEGADQDAIREHLPRELNALAQWLGLSEAVIRLPLRNHHVCVRGTLASSRATPTAGRARS